MPSNIIPHQGETRDLVDCRKCGHLYPGQVDSNVASGHVWECGIADQITDPPELEDGDPSYRECGLYVAKG